MIDSPLNFRWYSKHIKHTKWQPYPKHILFSLNSSPPSPHLPLICKQKRVPIYLKVIHFHKHHICYVHILFWRVLHCIFFFLSFGFILIIYYEKGKDYIHIIISTFDSLAWQFEGSWLLSIISRVWPKYSNSFN